MRILLYIVVALAAAIGISLVYFNQPVSSPPQPALSAQVLAGLPEDRRGQVLIYGAYGFTGAGISRLAADYGVEPVLAGRNENKLKPLAEELGYNYVVLSLDNPDNLIKVLQHFELVLHIAGPYTFTAKPMLDAAVATGTHYLDITGENHVITAQLERDEEFKQANIMVMPAVGYDVVPTDCLNLYVAQQIEQPDKLTVLMNGNHNAIAGAGLSRGTAKSGLEILSRPQLMRQNGKMVQVEAAKVISRVQDGREQTLVQIPWADMVTSFVSTGIPTIEVYQVQEGEIPSWLPRIAQYPAGRRLLSWLIDKNYPPGPPPGAQQNRQTHITSTASNAAGDSATATLITPEAYLLTFHSTLIVVKRVLAGDWQPGFQTVAQVYGPDLVLEVPGTSREDS